MKLLLLLSLLLCLERSGLLELELPVSGHRSCVVHVRGRGISMVAAWPAKMRLVVVEGGLLRDRLSLLMGSGGQVLRHCLCLHVRCTAARVLVTVWCPDCFLNALCRVRFLVVLEELVHGVETNVAADIVFHVICLHLREVRRRLHAIVHHGRGAGREETAD